MNENAVLASAIGNFIEKHWNNPEKVKLPVCEFEIKAVHHVNVDIDSLENVCSGLWSFKGTAQISFTDRSEVVLTQKKNIIGSAKTVVSLNGMSSNEKELFVKHAIITKLNEAAE